MQNFKSTVRGVVNNEDLEELQSRLAFQEDLLNGLNTQVAKQEQEISVLQKQLQHLYKKMASLTGGMGDSSAGIDELPPHY